MVNPILKWLPLTLFIFYAGKIEAQSEIVFKTFLSLKQEQIVMQKFDYSCGSASLATLMNYFKKGILEKDILNSIKKSVSKKEYQQILDEGLSLKNLRDAAEGMGFKATGLAIKPNDLYQANIPILVFLKKKMLNHFTVFTAYHNGVIHIKDPVLGHQLLSEEEFEKMYQGKALFVNFNNQLPPKDDLKVRSFNLKTISRAISTHLANFP